MTTPTELDEDLPVTCDGCPARSEAGWGDSPFCVDCTEQGRATEGVLCPVHRRTYVDDTCPLEHEPESMPEVTAQDVRDVIDAAQEDR